MLRTAINQDWPISATVQADIIRELRGEAKAIINNDSPKLRRYVAFMRVLMAMGEAEGLIKTLGARPGAAGSWKNGRAAVEGFMAKIGVPADQFRVDDGSGLSRENRLSASAAVRVLSYMFKRDAATAGMFRSSLAVAGVDGSLRNRLKTPDVKGRIFAKTGYIAGVRTLAGYVHTHADRWLAFAFFYDNAAATRPMTKAQNRACRLLVELPK